LLRSEKKSQKSQEPQQSAQSTSFKSRQQIVTVWKLYMEKHGSYGDMWWLEMPPAKGFVDKALDVVEREKEKIRLMLFRYGTVSNEAMLILGHFQKFHASIQLDTFQSIGVASEDEEMRLAINQGKEISFVPRTVAVMQSAQHGQKALLAWRPDFGIMISGVDMPEKLEAGILFHEMLHATRRRVFPPHSIQYGMEEMDAHALEVKVFNAASLGEYFKLYDAIIARAPKDARPDQVLATITLADLEIFDNMLDMRTAGQMVADYAIAAHWLGLAEYYMEKKEYSKEDKAKLFLWLMSP